KIFDPFFTTKPIGKGTGLGLYASYQIIVEKHRGKLECISESDRGTSFIIYLPIVSPSVDRVQ
ncbi:MAG: ATP-binding protein, partial [Microcoleus sp.]